MRSTETVMLGAASIRSPPNASSSLVSSSAFQPPAAPVKRLLEQRPAAEVEFSGG